MLRALVVLAILAAASPPASPPASPGAAAPTGATSPARNRNESRDRSLTRIWATTMEAQRITGRSDRGDRYLNAGDHGAALPHRSALGRTVRVRSRITGKSVVVPVIDVGPWNVDDAYWERREGRPSVEGHRPDARGRRSNGAGIDLSPATWISLGAPRADVDAGRWSGWVDWEFVDEVETP